MVIKSINLENFTVFTKIQCDFSPSINIFIGENGTGKTHMLKVLYAFCSCKTFFDETSDEPSKLRDDFFLVLKKCFQDKSLAQLVAPESKSMNISIDSGEGSYSFPATISMKHNGGTSHEVAGVATGILQKEKSSLVSTFITSKEMLSHSKGLTSLYNEYKLPFDTTQIDIIGKAQFPVARTVPSIAKNIIPHLENILDGIVIEDNDEFFIEKRDGRRVPFALEAEGIKKIGVLWKLLVGKRITADTILFWDEPEANINPTIMPVVVDTLLELSRQGVQIFVSTHDYLFAKYFEVRRADSNSVRFHSLYKNKDGAKGVNYEYNENFRDLKQNPIIAAYDDLLDEVIRLNLGD